MGQHLLISDSVGKMMVNLAQVDENDSVVEIGAGEGILTREIASRNVRRVLAFEIDRGLFNIARNNIKGFRNVELILGDAFDLLNRETDFQVLVSSLPYSRSLDFVKFLSLWAGSFRSAVVLVQNEFARKLMATPGDSNYRSISVLAQISFNLQIFGLVGKSSFRPQPKVDSVILQFLPKVKPFPFFNEARLELLGSLFSFRGRVLQNALRAANPSAAGQLLSDPNLSRRRVETLTPFEFSNIIARMSPKID